MSEAKPRDRSSANKTAFLVRTRTKLTNRYDHILRNLFVQIWRPLVLVKIKEKIKINNSIGD